VTSGKVLIVGGGIAGVTAALELAQLGIASTIVEREAHLGGQAGSLACKAADQCNRCFACVVETQMEEVRREPQVSVILEGSLGRVTGEPGRFEAEIQTRDGQTRLEVSALLIATGADLFDARRKREYGYGIFQNVITARDLDGMLRSEGRVYRPSDGAVPSKIAFFQCVGSRDEAIGHLWCSKVCCAYALRFIRAIRHHSPGTKTTFFYTDIQPLGRSFESLVESCRLDEGIRLVRSLPSKVYGHRTSTDLGVRFIEPTSGEIVQEAFDLVVLSIGMAPRHDAEELASALHILKNQEGFYRSPPHQSGVFVSGACKGPTDIAGSMMDARATALKIDEYLGGL